METAPKTLVSTRPATPKAKGSVAPRKVVWMADGSPVLAWETVHGGTQKDGTPNRLHVLTDALTGKKIIEWQGVQTGTGNSQYSGTVQLGTYNSGGTYYLRDTGRGNHDTTNLNGATSGRARCSATPTTTGAPARRPAPRPPPSTRLRRSETWDFYKNVFGRSGIRGDGVGAYSRVHYSSGYVNAFWDDSCFCMTYGDGQGNRMPLTELDVAGHEMTHGVTSNTAGLIYQGESGGLNEATSDIMATAMEFWSNNSSDPGDYLIGEKLNIRGNGAPLRIWTVPARTAAPRQLVAERRERGRALLVRHREPLLLPAVRGQRLEGDQRRLQLARRDAAAPVMPYARPRRGRAPSPRPTATVRDATR